MNDVSQEQRAELFGSLVALALAEDGDGLYVTGIGIDCGRPSRFWVSIADGRRSKASAQGRVSVTEREFMQAYNSPSPKSMAGLIAVRIVQALREIREVNELWEHDPSNPSSQHYH